MSEKLNSTHEQHEALPILPTAEQAEPLRKGEKDPTLALSEARKTVSETAKTEAQFNPVEAHEASVEASAPTNSSSTIMNRELKLITVRREIKNIQRKLPAPQRALSKVIHQPTVRVVSEAAGKTVSRPSGLLGGGILAFIGTTGYFYLAQHIGFTYNYFIVILLMVAGFGLGLVLELLVTLATTSRRARNNS